MIRLGKLTDILTLGVVGVIGYLAYKFIKDPAGLGGIGKGISDFFGNLFPGGILAGGLFPGGLFKPVDQAAVDMATFGTSTDVRATWNLPEILPIAPDILAKAVAFLEQPVTTENIAAKGMLTALLPFGGGIVNAETYVNPATHTGVQNAIAVERPIAPVGFPTTEAERLSGLAYFTSIYSR